MEKHDKKFTIDVFMEGPGGTLVFNPIKASKNDLKKLIEASKNPVIKMNVFKQGNKKRVDV